MTTSIKIYLLLLGLLTVVIACIMLAFQIMSEGTPFTMYMMSFCILLSGIFNMLTSLLWNVKDVHKEF